MHISDFLPVNPRDDLTMAQQLRQQVTWMIANGKIKAGEQLPSIHALAGQLHINLQTVRSAYKKLEADGLVVTRQGRGTHVLPVDLQRFSQAAVASRSHTVGVIIPSWTNPFYHAFLQGVEEISEKDHTLLFLCNTHDDPDMLWREFARLAAKQVDGILVVSHDISDLVEMSGGQTHALPVVSVDWPLSRGYAVQLDLLSAGWQATRHLLEHGHQRVGLITVSIGGANVRAVNRGYERALLEADINPQASLIAAAPGFGMLHGAHAVRQLLGLENPPTAIFTIADTLALGAMQAIKAAGFSIPGDIALASFNDIPAASLVEPSLTTVSAPALQMGREAMGMLQTLIEGRQPIKRRITLPTQLIIRQSCGTHPNE